MADYIPVAKTADVPAGTVRTFQAGGEDIAIANVNGEFYAIANVCTHDGGPLGEGQVFGQLVECPRHGARFDVKTGQARALPAVLPVHTYELQVEDDEIMVRLNSV
jgi:3-phenylpropionate/trans-cinnamate dioxygenase ferredoxin component